MREKKIRLQAWEIKLGQRWKAARRKANLSAGDVSSHLKEHDYDCDKSVIYRLESGRTQPINFQIYMMLVCRLYGISPNDILGAKKEV